MKVSPFRIIMNSMLITSSILINTQISGQSGVGINPTGAAPHPSAILDASSTSQGILIPRLTESERNDISSPATGLQIFNTTTGCFNVYTGATWKQMCAECAFQIPSVNNNSPICEGNNLNITATSLSGASYSWTGPNGFSSTLQNPSIGGATVAAGGIYSLTVTLDGCTANPVTTLVTINAVPSAPSGSSNSPVCEDGTLNLSASNITGANYNWTGPNGFVSSEQNPSIVDFPIAGSGNYSVTATVDGCTGIAGTTNVTVIPLAVAPVSGTHTAAGSQIIWNWNTVSGATGYKWNTTNDYNTANGNSTSTTHTQSGLNYNTPYNLYVWAYNSCGHSPTAVLSQSTTPFQCGTESITFTYKGASVTYGTVNGSYNSGQYCWLDRNLGASQVATSTADANALGDLFQWGRPDDLHQNRNSPTQSGSTTSTNPGNMFFTGGTNWYSGSSPSYDTFWQGVNGLNNPCPSGFRLPTRAEWDNERNSWSQNNMYGAYNSPLKLTAAGQRYIDGAIQVVGSVGLYWWSTVYYGGDANLTSLKFSDSGAYANYEVRSYGASVRCIRN